MRGPLATVTAATVLTVLFAWTPPTGASPAAPATCNGRSATVVGVPGQEVVTGTEGDDVIVADAPYVDALGGDDTICVTGVRRLSAGAGDDWVSSHSPAQGSRVELGDGSDVYEGSDDREFVYAETRRYEEDLPTPVGGSHHDVIRTHGGRDRVDTGHVGLPNSDDVDTGAGSDWIRAHGAPGGAPQLTGGGGRDTISVEHLGVVDVAVDMAAGTSTLAGQPDLAWRDVERLWLEADEAEASVTGTSGPDWVRVEGRVSHVSALAGRDVLHVEARDHLGDVVGGRGWDQLTILTPGNGGRLGVDLRARRASLAGRSSKMATERLMVWSYVDSVRVLGSGRRDDVTVSGCDVTLRGRGGPDRLRLKYGCGNQGNRLFGGPGDDLLVGAGDDDLLLGGGGRDSAVGRGGRDTCRAEQQRGCER